MITAGKDTVRLGLRRGHDARCRRVPRSLAAAAPLEPHGDADGERATLDLDVDARIEPDQLTSSVLCPRVE